MPSLPSKSLRKMRRKPCRRSAFLSIMVHTCSHNPQGYNFYILWSFMIYITSCSALWHKLNTSAFHFITWCHAGNSWDAASFKWFLSELSWMPTNCRKVNKLPKTWNMQNTDLRNLRRIITEEHVMYMFDHVCMISAWFESSAVVASFCAASKSPHCPCPCEVLPLCENFAHANEPELLNDTQCSSQY